MITFKHAKAPDLALGSDGNEYWSGNIEVIDLDTGKTPIDENGHELHFTEVDTEKNFGLAFTKSVVDGRPVTVCVTGRFELRLKESEAT